jgi:hypothetical protein
MEDQNKKSSAPVERAFNEFDAELNLDPVERLRAITFHNELTARLMDDGVISGSFLQGSFARKTMLSPLRDIDKIFLLHSKYDSWFTGDGGAIAAAELVESALRMHYPDAKFDRTRHALQLELGEDTFSFDVVPAFEAVGDTTDVMIMDLEQASWMRSNTRELIKVVADRNKTCEGAFVHQVRFVKHWKRLVLGDRLPGLHVESIAFACVDEPLGHAEAVLRIFARGVELLGSGYCDPTGAERLSDKLADVDREAARQAFVDAAALSSRALELDESGQEHQAVATWLQIFGNLFGVGDSTGADYLRGLGAGAAVVGAKSSAPGATTTRAWAP